ncbi:TetR/AcrR family transcriptional regulator [Nocardia uniformis]|uniref:TetR/AcrR family transcriptional regulator n=1 Tax=Nocardia uniformis TaxID=53432 RepID=A0A849C3W7_9NOCA|nr:TetR/AcrR family transcriptional regulator [Nocardia uniformis]NNH70467.1 TetR/AcrR family transcriptional regulator [Nocardia uniformis]
MAVQVDAPRANSAPPAAVDATADRILDAALTVFGSTGIRGTSMEDVARAAKLARSGVYRYFRTKNDLIEAAVMRELQRYLYEFDEATAELHEPSDIAVEGFVFTVRFADSSPILGKLLRTDSDLIPYLTIQGGSLIAVARAFLVDRIQSEAQWSGDWETPQEVAETAVRLAMSFVTNRDSCVDLGDDTAVRGYATRVIAPLATLFTVGPASPP